jgi:hypothetical protein
MYTEDDVENAGLLFFGDDPAKAANKFGMTGQFILLITLNEEDLEQMKQGKVCAVQINGNEYHVAVCYKE